LIFPVHGPPKSGGGEYSSFVEDKLTDQLHPMTPHHLPFYLAKPGGDTDVLMIVMGIFLIAALLGVGNLYLQLHSLPERMAHKSQKLQFEIVAVLGLLALFTHMHVLWIAALLLALVDLPDFGTPLRSIAGSVGKMAGSTEAGNLDEIPAEEPVAQSAAAPQKAEPSVSREPIVAKKEVHGHV
jgi:hypothetical protein